MLKIFKNKWFWIVAVIILLIVGFGAYKLLTAAPATTYTTEPVKKGALVQTVSATGMVESAHEITLNFKNPGRINYQPVKQGDTVKAGDVLVRIDSGSIGALIKQYEAGLASAKANLDKVKAGAATEDVKLTQEQLIKAQNDYDNLVRESESQTQILREKTNDSVNNAIFSIQTTLNTVYNDLINRETTSNLLTSDSNLQNKVLNDYGTLTTKFSDLRILVQASQTAVSGDQTKIIAAADATRAYLVELNAFLDNAYALSDKIIINTTYTQTVKDGVKTDISTQQTANNTSLTTLQTNRSTLINTANSYQSQIQAASNTVSITSAQLALKQAGPRSFDVDSAQAQVAQAQATLDKTRSDAQDYVITAPIDGKITKINYSIGETPNATLAVIQMLGNERYEIKLDIPESDITKIRVGEKSIIELDAFGSDHPFSGAVTFIDPAQTSINDVTYYKTTVIFNSDSWSDQIKPGMTANITIMSDEKADVLYIPQRAVKIRATTLGETPQKYVQVLVNQQPTEKNVTIGLRGDNGLVEITSGLNEGEPVITFTQTGK